ncbi:HAUS augmin-like complex subunit 8 [Narcine bancroftii]|uniref:HAUS augmin-like complex subunit 8 n=1 Tax=Narcine bancroftii TaxID=1343680 RepID=UPI0038311571
MAAEKDELSGCGRQIRSSKSATDLSESKSSSNAQKPSSSAMPCQRPTVSSIASKLRLTQSNSTLKTRGVSQHINIKKSNKEKNEGLNPESSVEECTKKLKGARIVPSRFREAAAMRKKVVNKSHEESSRPELKRSNAERKPIDLHSTGLEESMLMPSLNWDLSAMKPEYSTLEVPECTTVEESTSLSPLLSEDEEIEKMNFDTLLFSYMAVTRENNLQKYQEKAEQNLLLLEEENQHLRKKIFEEKQEYLLRENKKRLNSIIGQQMELLKLVVPVIQQFKIQYQCFGQALDATRHSLPVKNVYVSEDPRKDLENLKKHLETSQQLLSELRADREHFNSLAEIKELGVTVENAAKGMKSYFGKIEEMASCVSRESVLLHQNLDEQALGMDVSAKGIFK